MRRPICRIGCCILLGLALVALMSCERDEIQVEVSPKPKQDTVTISGKVIFEGYEKEPIVVGAKSEGGEDIAFVEIPKPGKYALKVPVNVEDINLAAVNIRMGKMPRADTPAGGYERNPLKVGSSDIGGVDIVIVKPITELPAASTVTISGKVIFEGYEKKPIVVVAHSKEGEDIAFVEIPKPGKYALKVPANVGDINLIAINKRLRNRPSADNPVGEYEGNPLKVGSSDIGTITIVISGK